MKRKFNIFFLMSLLFIPNRALGQQLSTQTVLEWLSHPNRERASNSYLAPLLVVPELWKSVEQIEVKGGVLQILVNVDKGFAYLKDENKIDYIAWQMMQNFWDNMQMITAYGGRMGFFFDRNIFEEFPKLNSIVWVVAKIRQSDRLDKYGRKLSSQLDGQTILKIRLTRQRGLKQIWGNIITEAIDKYLPIGSFRLGARRRSKTTDQPSSFYKGI